MDDEGTTARAESSSSPSPTFDYVIVGAGPSATGLLYGLLSPYCRSLSGPPFTIAVVERGHGPLSGHQDPPLTRRDPRRWYQAAHQKNSPNVVHYPSEMTGRRIDIPVGSGVGGTSNINACLCMAPLAEDLETWPKAWSEGLMNTAKEIQGILERNGSLDFGLAAEDEVPSPLNKSIETSSRIPSMVAKRKDGTFERKTYFTGLLEPLFDDYPHLASKVSWFCRAEAQRILFRGNKAVGVELESENCLGKILATKELILCAGAIETPALLLISGCQENTQGIGKNLRDQVIYPRIYLHSWRNVGSLSCNTIAQIGNIRVDGKIFQVAVCDAASYEFILPGAIALGVRRSFRHKFWQSLWEKIFRLLKSFLWFLICVTPVGVLLRHCSTPVLICLMHPASSGRIEISCTNADSSKPLRKKDTKVIVDTGYFRDFRDICLCAKAWRAMKKSDNCIDIFSGPFLAFLERLGLNWFEPFLRFASQPYFHWCGTCPMETEQNEEWVVDSKLRVRNYDSLRVCDASVFPGTISSPPGLCCSAIGLLLARRILSELNM